MDELERTLARIDGRGYKAYKDIAGSHPFDDYWLVVDHVQADPFAAPSRVRAVVDWQRARLPEAIFASDARRRAARDYIARAFRAAARDERDVAIDAGGQTVLDRSAVIFREQALELRFTVNLPARGRTILGRQARALLCERLPRVVRAAATAEQLDTGALERHAETVEDQTALRAALAAHGLVAFVGEGAILPRRSGVDQRPLEDAIALRAPESLRVELEAPNAGRLTGLGLRRGVTLIVGGGFHGKSTLLAALEQGIYDHVPGDGRETVVTEPDAVKIRAEDGRAVQALDLSPYINDLPYGKKTTSFTTASASGSTSQAAALQEALEAGATSLLVDEDTSATNFMIRDERMQALVAKSSEPITPFVDRVRQLRDELDVSTLLVMGGSGDYFDCADAVIQMQDYLPHDVTERAREIAASHVTGRREETSGALTRPARRVLVAGSLQPEVKPGKRKLQARGLDALVFGRETVDLRAVEQIVDASQVRAIATILAALARERGEVEDPPGWLRARLEDADWLQLASRPDGDLARPRAVEVMAALSRLRDVTLAQR